MYCHNSFDFVVTVVVVSLLESTAILKRIVSFMSCHSLLSFIDVEPVAIHSFLFEECALGQQF